MTNAVLYTDGSATIRPDGTFYCGYAYVIVIDGEPVVGKAFPGIGTINQAEMCAVYAGMADAMQHDINITSVYTDSTYVINGLIANMDKYESGEWTNTQGSEVLNKEMWINLIEFSKRTGKTIPTVHVKGHTGQPFNELCDKLAKEAAMSQKTVTEYLDVDKCEELGFCLPRTIEPIPLPAISADPMHVSGELVKALSEYTDDRAKCCYIEYTGMMHAVVSRGMSYWKDTTGEVATDQLTMGYKVHPVVTDDGSELPLYRYMTESGTPLNVVLDSSTVVWQGDDFKYAIRNAIDEILMDGSDIGGSDLVIASYNLSSFKKYQGVYFASYSPSCSGRVLDVYRTERMPQGKCMRIPNAYLAGIIDMLNNCNDAVIGTIINTTMMGLIITGTDGGMLVGSSVIPHTITIDDSLIINMDKPEKPNVRFPDMVKAQAAIDKALLRVIPGSDLATVIPKQEYVTPPVVTTSKKDSYIIYEPMPEISVTSVSIEGPPMDIPEDAKLLKEYLEITAKMKELLTRQQEIIEKLMSNEYPPMTPDKVAEIENRVRADMLKKFNDMFK